MSAPERLATIEACARVLDAQGSSYIKAADTAPLEEVRMDLFGLGHAYHMAAEDLRRLNPEYAARADEYRSAFREWCKALEAGIANPLPVMRKPSGSTDH